MIFISRSKQNVRKREFLKHLSWVTHVFFWGVLSLACWLGWPVDHDARFGTLLYWCHCHCPKICRRDVTYPSSDGPSSFGVGVGNGMQIWRNGHIRVEWMNEWMMFFFFENIEWHAGYNLQPFHSWCIKSSNPLLLLSSNWTNIGVNLQPFGGEISLL